MTGAAPVGTRQALDLGAPPPPGRRHDPRIDPPTKRDKRRLLGWVALLGFTPLCLGVVAWASFGLNGSYPTVKPPVPKGWKALPGIYASISVPRAWSLQDELSDPAGDIYYSGDGGGVGLTVDADAHEPSPAGKFPDVVRDYLGGTYQVTSVRAVKLRNAADAWRIRFAVAGGTTGDAILAWARVTSSEVWLVATTVTPATNAVLSTLTLAS